MFTEFMYIALAVCLLLCAGTEGHLAYGMSFGTLLRAAIAAILLELLKMLEYIKQFWTEDTAGAYQFSHDTLEGAILASFWRHFLTKSQLGMNSGSTQGSF